MCGRTVISLRCSCINNLLGGNVEWEGQEKYSPSYNVTPGKYQPIILPSKSGVRVLSSMKWGLRVKNFPHQPCNARAETVTTKYMFSRLLNSKRCVVICEGYYEWQTVIPGKQPFLIKPTNGPLFYFAGLYDTYTDSNGETIQTYTIITTASSKSVAPVHIRMPAILVGNEIDQWLNASTIEEAVKLLRPYEGELEIIPVSYAVGNSKNDYADLVKEIEVKKEIDPNPVKIEKYFSVIHNNKKIKTEGGSIPLNTLKKEKNFNNNNSENNNNNNKIEEIIDDDKDEIKIEKNEQTKNEFNENNKKKEEKEINVNKRKYYQLFRNDLNENNNGEDGNNKNNNNNSDDHYVYSISDDEDIPFSPPCSPSKDNINNNNNKNKHMNDNNKVEITKFFKPVQSQEIYQDEKNKNNNKNKNKNNVSPFKKEKKSKPIVKTIKKAPQKPIKTKPPLITKKNV